MGGEPGLSLFTRQPLALIGRRAAPKPCQSNFTAVTKVTSEKRGRAVILAASPNQLKTAVGTGTGALFLILSVKATY